MKKKIKGNAVYSTDQSRLCPQCHRAVANCACGSNRPSHVGDGIVRISRETKGRGGKAVTVINGLPVPPAELKAISKTLKHTNAVWVVRLKASRSKSKVISAQLVKTYSSTLDLPANSPVARLEGNECLLTRSSYTVFCACPRSNRLG